MWHVTQLISISRSANDGWEPDSWKGLGSDRRCWPGRSSEGRFQRPLGMGRSLQKQERFYVVSYQCLLTFEGATYFLVAAVAECTALAAADVDKVLIVAQID